MTKFKVGDRVEIVKADRACAVGDTGVIRQIEQDDNGGAIYAVEFDVGNKDWMHDCKGNTAKERGWWCTEDDIKLICEQNTNKVKWIDATKALPDEKTIIEYGLWCMVETYSCYPICMGDYNKNKYVFPACYNQHTKIWHVFYSDDRNVYINALLHESDTANWNTIVTRWKPMPRRVEDEDEM